MVNDERIKIRFVGTGSAKTNLKRFHTSFIISRDVDNILIDCGDGISRKLAELQINLNSIKNILITHTHPDHFSGIAALLVNMKMIGRESPISIFIHQDLMDFVKYFFAQSYLFFERFDFPVDFKTYNCEEKTILNDCISFQAKENSHLSKYHQLVKSKKVKSASSSFLFEIGNKKIFYSSDIGDKSDLHLFKDEFNACIIESTHIEISEIVEYLNGNSSNKYFLVHIDEEREELLKSNLLDKISKGKVFIPNDGDEYLI